MENKYTNKGFEKLGLLRNAAVKGNSIVCRGQNMRRPGTMKFRPPVQKLPALHEDYEYMRDMIFGSKPTFDEIMGELERMEDEVNRDRVEGRLKD